MNSIIIITLGIACVISLMGWYSQHRRGERQANQIAQLKTSRASCDSTWEHDYAEMQQEIQNKYRIHRTAKASESTGIEADHHVWFQSHNPKGDLVGRLTEGQYQEALRAARTNEADSPYFVDKRS